MGLISPAYIEEQRVLHDGTAYGSRGFNWGFLVAGIAQIEKCASVLDYGCGKGTLGRTLRDAGLDARDYDPAVWQFSALPASADLVVSVDVMEHIEPDRLGEVLDHVASLTRKILFVAISTRPAKRWLSDGRNSHLIVEAGSWWRPKFEARGFAVRRVWETALPEWVAMMERRR